MAASDDRTFLAADVYPTWRSRVKNAVQSVRIYSPYLDRLAVSLLGNSELGPEDLSVVTDLSPASGTLAYRGQLFALKRLLNEGVKVRSLPRLHAKVLLVDGETVTVGSQNFTSYGRGSHETTSAPPNDLSESRFVDTLERWYAAAESVDVDLIDRLLENLETQIADAKAAIESLVSAYEVLEEGYREEQRQAALSRFEQDLATARSSTTSGGIRRAADVSRYTAGQSVAYARLEWLDAGYRTLMRSTSDLDLTRWRTSVGGTERHTINLTSLNFYPALLGPERRLAFVRVGRSRISYVWRGLRRSAPLTVGRHSLHVRANFPDDQTDNSNLLLTFGWAEGAPSGYQLRLQFDGKEVVPLDHGTLIGAPWGGDDLARIVSTAYENKKAWNRVLRDVFEPVTRPVGFRNDPNADTFFPRGWLRIDLTRFLGEAVLLIEPRR